MTGSKSHTRKPGTRRYELAIVTVLAVVFATLWILSLAGVRARLATRAWERGDVESAYRLAAMATRQRPKMADMWVLQAHCEERLESPCKAALSYARAVLASNEQVAQNASEVLVSGSASDSSIEATRAGASLSELRGTALGQALVSAGTCASVSTLATVFEALTAGLPSDPEQRGGIWPGQPEVATGRETPESLSTVLPDEPELRLRWIEFLWRRREARAALGAAKQLLSAKEDVSAAGLWKLGRILSASGDGAGATQALWRALDRDPGWIPAAADVRRFEGDRSHETDVTWREQELPLEGAVVDAPVSELRADTLILATNGSVTFEIDVPTGTQRAFVVLETWGTAANGRFPEVGLLVDGDAKPSFEATEIAFPTVVEIPSGAVGTVTIAFTFNNDWADAHGDRNVFLGVPTLYHSQ